MRSWLFILVFGFFAALLTTSQAQQKGKGKEKDKGPMYPPINPAIAKLEITVTGLDGPGFAIATGKENDLIVAACENGTLLAYNKIALEAFKPKDGIGKPNVWKGHQGPVREIAWTGGPTLVSVGADKKVNFWKMPEGKVAQTANADFRVLAAAMSPDGKTFAIGGESDTIQLFDVAAGKATTKLTDKMDWTRCLAFSADGKQLLSGDELGVVRLWDVSGKKIKDFSAQPAPKAKVTPDPIAATSVAFAPDGKTILIGTENGPIAFVNLGDGKILRTLVGHTSPVTGMVFHPSGTLLATCSKDRTVKLWNPAAAAPLKSLDGHDAWIEGIVFIEQGAKLATVSADRTVRIWDLTDPTKIKTKKK
ncbi:MAG: WD40 repeat domain-containing protein [Planctomycetes bacterium]|nr:WD40 repeat domain-containing protein [Planctomycetota bacterium]